MKYLFSLLFVLCSCHVYSDIYVPYNDPEFKTIVRTLKSIPDEFKHTKYDMSIQSITDKEAYNKYVWMEDGLLGVTDIKANHISIMKDEAKKYHVPISDVIYHEYGHEVWFQMMNTDEQREYEHLWYKEVIADKNPTKYGATHYEEGFAEACRLHWNHSKLQNPYESNIIDKVQKRLHDEE